MENAKINIKNINGETEEVEILMDFSFKNDTKRYVIYTNGETDNDGLMVISVSEMVKKEDGIELYGIEDENTWSKIKDVMKLVIKDGEEA